MSICHYTAQDIAKACKMSLLIDELNNAFLTMPAVPVRTVENIGHEKALHLMTATGYRRFYGVKLTSVYGENRIHNLPMVQGVYVLFNETTGTPVASFDAAEITARRTAATSALASRYLSRENATVLALASTGKLAPYIIEAHASVRDIKQVYLWGRNFSKAKNLTKIISNQFNIDIYAEADFSVACQKADIVSTATASHEAFLTSDMITPGVHIDLIGSHTYEMCEADPKCFELSTVYVDSLEAALAEAGDLHAAIRSKVINEEDIRGDLRRIVQSSSSLRKSIKEITLFKSVGTAEEDLAAAVLTHSGHFMT